MEADVSILMILFNCVDCGPTDTQGFSGCGPGIQHPRGAQDASNIEEPAEELAGEVNKQHIQASIGIM